MTEEGRREGRGEGEGSEEGDLLREETGELEQQIGVMRAGEGDIVEKVALRRTRW